MGTGNKEKLTIRTVEAAGPNGSRYEIWDSVIPGFGLRISSTGAKSFVLRYRPRGFGRAAPKRFLTIGRYGPVTPDEARRRAMQVPGEVAKGNDPVAHQRAGKNTMTVADAGREFMSTHVTPKRKPKTAELYGHAIDKKIVPALGKRTLKDLSRNEIARFHHSMRATPHMANRVIAVLATIYTWAGRRGFVAEEFNPARRIEKFPEAPRERFLSQAEFARLGAALREGESGELTYEVDETRPKAKHAAKPENRRVIVAPEAVAAIRLLMLTGCRLREILNLRWQEVDLERGMLLLSDSKTGRKTVLLGAGAVEILRELPRVSPFVFPGVDGTKPRSDLKRPWTVITRRAGLKGLRLHDLRHSFASVAAGAGMGLPVIGKLLGHSQPSTTARYAHLADKAMRLASDAVSLEITNAMEATEPPA